MKMGYRDVFSPFSSVKLFTTAEPFASCASRADLNGIVQAAAKLSPEASSWDILALVSGARRRWYSVMQAEEQKCMCQ
jgi:hypothetical protein